MAGKLLFLVLVAGATAASLLVIRHERIETAHQMSRVYRQTMDQQRTLWVLRWTIAQHCRPEEIRRLMSDVAVDWSVIPEPQALPAPAEEPGG